MGAFETSEGRRFHSPLSSEKQKFLNLHIAKQKLEEVMYLLGE
ncbi:MULTISPECIES: hypothetical protein [unclassified Nostoc]|nr:hypothetical protein [Nostoc sp. JL31]